MTTESIEGELTPEAALAFLKGGLKNGHVQKIKSKIDSGTAEEVIPPVTKEETDCHYFSRELAREHGVKEAIVLKYLSYKVRNSRGKRNWQDGKRWYYNSVEAIAERYKYIPRATLGDILKRLRKKSLISVGKYNRKKYDRTAWYSVERMHMNAAEKELIAFNVEVAIKLGIAAAVLYKNLSYYVGLKRCAGNPNPVHPMSPSMLVDYLPFSKSTLKSALKCLVEAGYIFKDEEAKTMYGLLARNDPRGQKPDEVGQKPDEKGQISDRVGQKSDEKGQKPDNYTTLVTDAIPLEVPVEKNTFKTSGGKPPRSSPVLQEIAEGSDLRPNLNEGESATGNDKLRAALQTLVVNGENLKESLQPPAGAGTLEMTQPNSHLNTNSSQTSNKASNSQHGEAVTTEDGFIPKQKYTWKQLLDCEEEIPKTIDEEDRLVEFLANACALFASEFSVSDIITLRDITNDNECVAFLYEMLKPRFDAVFARPEILRSLPSMSRGQVEKHLLRMLIAGLKQLPNTWANGTVHKVAAIHRSICHIASEMKGRLFTHEREQAELEYQRKWDATIEEVKTRMLKFKSIDEDKHDDPDLAPAVKARTLRNFVQSMNAFGLPFTDCSIKENLFKWDKRADEMALSFFELNPFIRVNELFKPLQWSGYKSLEDTPDPVEEHDPYFHARRGNDVGFFLKHLEKVIRQLELTGEYGHILFLNNDDEGTPPPCPFPVIQSVEAKIAE